MQSQAGRQYLSTNVSATMRDMIFKFDMLFYTTTRVNMFIHMFVIKLPMSDKFYQPQTFAALMVIVLPLYSINCKMVQLFIVL